MVQNTFPSTTKYTATCGNSPRIITEQPKPFAQSVKSISNCCDKCFQQHRRAIIYSTSITLGAGSGTLLSYAAASPLLIGSKLICSSVAGTGVGCLIGLAGAALVDSDYEMPSKTSPTETRIEPTIISELLRNGAEEVNQNETFELDPSP